MSEPSKAKPNKESSNTEVSSKYSVEELIEAITDCNEALYRQAHPNPDSLSYALNLDALSPDEANLWQQSPGLLDQRALFLAQLSSILNTLNAQQINIVGHLYESMLATDQQHMKLAQAEQLNTRNSLRAIKNAEKALPAYKAHDKK
ncbi:MAG: hypothetical protein ACI8WB_001521 [Phenylobacterium sp.]